MVSEWCALRSTCACPREHQNYSIGHQEAAIAAYAARRGHLIVRTYTDAAISGLRLENREGLKSLLSTVVAGAADFSVILTYDVSRWGRFQDPDQSAHYEFICREAGVGVEYCAEPFDNDGSLTATLVKHLKRAMAAEFSRDLSVKVGSAQRRLAEIGFWQGGPPGFGLRRRVVRPDGGLGAVLEAGEWKAIFGDRTILVAGPDAEVELVRRIYLMFVVHGLSRASISRALNAEGETSEGGARWSQKRVHQVLTNEKYAGVLVFGKTGGALQTPRRRRARASWTRALGATPPIISPTLFAMAKRNIERRAHRMSDADMLGGLRDLLAAHGRITAVLCFDEVQEMSVASIEKVLERVSGSKVKFVLLGSTANHPEGDIDYFYNRGDKWRFHTRCPVCGAAEPLDEYFPACIGYDTDFPNSETGALGDYRYRCRAGHWIYDAQVGEWRPTNPEGDPKTTSIHFHQMLSPTVTAGEIYLAYLNAQDIKNFYNRKLGKPYQDPTELPVTEAHLAACVKAGASLGVTWKRAATNTFMGIDQMGGFNCVVIKERLPDGRDAVIHVEEIHDDAPFDRCTELMKDFGVQICVVEQLPNVNDARRFANLELHRRRVFLCTGYDDLDDGVAHWGDGPAMTASQRRTDEADRDRWTVRIDQYKAMSSTLRRIAATGCLFPDPMALVQQVQEKDAAFDVPVLKERVFPHLLRTALVIKRTKELERKYRRVVEKRGKDPHHSYAFMLCDVAMSRAHGTAMFILPDLTTPEFPTASEHHPVVQEILLRRRAGTCGGCSNFQADMIPGRPKTGICRALPPVTEVGDDLPACEGGYSPL